MYKYNNIKMPIIHSDDMIKEALEKALGSKVSKLKILKKSIDARKKNDIHYIVNVAFDCSRSLSLDSYIPQVERLSELIAGIRKVKTGERIAIIGSGPSGLFAALTLANSGIGVDVYERGESVENRQKSILTFQKSGDLNTESNIQFGEGGAGTFSDGKLNTGIKSEYTACVYGEFVAYGANADIAYMSKPHIGTDVLINVVKNMRKDILRMGGNVYFNSKVEDIIVNSGKIVGITVNGEERKYSRVILACGHSARDTYEMLLRHGVEMETKPFAVGARIEHRQGLIDIAQYGRSDDSLPPADYKLAEQVGKGKSCFTFCMCPGGEIMPSTSEKNGVVTNGMSRRARNSGYANSAILVGVEPKEFGCNGVLAGIDYQRRLEQRAYDMGSNYSAPAIMVKDFVSRKESSSLPKDITTYSRGIYGGKFFQCLPEPIISAMIEGIKAFGRKIRNFDSQGVLVGVETRSSSPVRVVRSETMMSNIAGLFPTGEGAGYAGGITSSAVDGIKAAIAVIESLRI